MRDLPKVFKNKIDKKISNNETVYYGGNNNNMISNNTNGNQVSKKNITQKINDIFSSPNYIYKTNVEITLNDKITTKRIIGRNKDYIITMDNELIKISDIIDIKVQKK